MSNFAKKRNSTKQSHFKQGTPKSLKRASKNTENNYQNNLYGTEFDGGDGGNIYDDDDVKMQKILHSLNPIDRIKEEYPVERMVSL